MKKLNSAEIVIRKAETAADIRYLCGTEPPEAALFIRSKRNLILIVSDMELGRMKKHVHPDVRVKTPEQIGSSCKKGPVDWIKKSVSDRKLTVDRSFPYGLAEKLKKAGFKLNLSGKPLCPQREIKTAEEIKAVQQSQRAAVAAMKTAVQLIASSKPASGNKLLIGKKPLTSEAVRAAICHRLLDSDCTAEETIVSCGTASADPHERGEGSLFAGQPIVIDIFPRSAKTGYWGDITRTVCRGPAPAELKKMYQTVKAAQAAQLKAVKAGVYTDTIHQTGVELMKKRGYQTGKVDGVPQGFIHGTGHGVGLEIHESPRISSAIHQKLRVGHVITVEPGLYYPELGGIRIEDTVAVTKEGYKMLVPCAKQLET